MHIECQWIDFCSPAPAFTPSSPSKHIRASHDCSIGITIGFIHSFMIVAFFLLLLVLNVLSCYFIAHSSIPSHFLTSSICHFLTSYDPTHSSPSKTQPNPSKITSIRPMHQRHEYLTRTWSIYAEHSVAQRCSRSGVIQFEHDVVVAQDTVTLGDVLS